MQRCKLCGQLGNKDDFIGPYCLRCDKVIADAYAEQAEEF